MSSVLYRGLCVPVFCNPGICPNTILCWNPAFIIKQTDHLTLSIPELLRETLNKHEPIQWWKSLKLLWGELGTLETTIYEEKNPQPNPTTKPKPATGTSQSSAGRNLTFFPAATKIRICAIEFALLWKQVDRYMYFFPSLPCQDLLPSALWTSGNLPLSWVWAAGNSLGWGHKTGCQVWLGKAGSKARTAGESPAFKMVTVQSNCTLISFSWVFLPMNQCSGAHMHV